MFGTTEAIAAFIAEFEAGTLPKPRWTHEAHFVAGLWYVTRLPFDAALATLRRNIRAYNERVGTANTDSSGYHETLTVLYLRGIAAHVAAHPGTPLPELLRGLLAAPLVARDYPLGLYSRERLFSVAARRGYVAPDLPAG